jgi:SAM-dependent methyltransferase
MKKKMRMVRRPCPVCSSRDDSNVFAEENFDPQRLDDFAFASRKIPELMHYRLVICPVCDLLYSNPLPTIGAISKGYEDAAFDSSEEAHYAARTYGRFLTVVMKNIPGTKGALDIGTGDGAFLEELLNKGFTGVAGVELSKAPIKASKENIRPLIRNSPFNPGNFKKSSMSLISCFQTFEHLYDPLEMCRSAHQLLKDKGAFFVVSHNRKSISAKLLGMKSPIYDIEHLQIFSPRSIKYLFEKAGFSQVTVKSLFNLYPLHYWLKLLPFPKKMKVGLIRALKKTGIGYIPIPLPAGNMVIIGYKNKT